MAGAVIPSLVAEALSVSLYAMLVTIVTQASKASKGTMMCVLSAIAVSVALQLLPAMKSLPSGLLVVIISVVISAVFALVAPIDEPLEDEEEVAG